MSPEELAALRGLTITEARTDEDQGGDWLILTFHDGTGLRISASGDFNQGGWLVLARLAT